MFKDTISIYYIDTESGKHLEFASIKRRMPKCRYSKLGRDYILTKASKARLKDYVLRHYSETAYNSWEGDI